MKQRIVLNEQAFDRTIRRLAHELSEKNSGESFALVGIQTRGVPLAKRLATIVGEIEEHDVNWGSIDVTLYRDDYRTTLKSEIPQGNQLAFSIDNENIVLVDDVLYTGRTIRAAIDELMSFGRPRRIQLLVLVDRGHRQLPIRADYVGKNLPTNASDQVKVKMMEIDGVDEVIINQKEE